VREKPAAVMPLSMVLTPGCVSQKLGLWGNTLFSLPHELSSLRNLKWLSLGRNWLPTVPVSVLSGMTALTAIDLSMQLYDEDLDEFFEVFKISTPLLPILHPGLVRLDLLQPSNHSWDSVSFSHLERARLEVAGRRPVPTLLFS
jgi:hypothetical protein